MSMPNDRLELWSAERHHQDLIHEAAKERMIREAFRNRPKPVPFYVRVLRWMRERFSAWRSRRTHRDAAPADAHPCSSPCPE